MVDASVIVAVAAAVSSAAMAIGAVAASAVHQDKFNILTVTNVDFDTMLKDPRYNQWFINNVRCSQATFARLVSLLRSYLPHLKLRKSNHSFAKKVAMTMYFLGSEGGYRETAAALGVSKAWCIHVVHAITDVLAAHAAD